MSFLRQHCADPQLVHEWVSNNNFRKPTQSKSYQLPAGLGRTFRRRMEALVAAVLKNLTPAFASEGYLKDVREAGEIGHRYDRRRRGLHDGGRRGRPVPTGRYPAELICGRILAQLEAFDAALCERHGAV